VVVCAPDWTYNIVQPYERLGAEGRHIGFVGEPDVLDTSLPDQEARGRGMSLFAEKPLYGEQGT